MSEKNESLLNQKRVQEFFEIIILKSSSETKKRRIYRNDLKLKYSSGAPLWVSTPNIEEKNSQYGYKSLLCDQ